MEKIAVIPARSGSKRLPKKNYKEVTILLYLKHYF